MCFCQYTSNLFLSMGDSPVLQLLLFVVSMSHCPGRSQLFSSLWHLILNLILFYQDSIFFFQDSNDTYDIQRRSGKNSAEVVIGPR
jgi:hypothetical protein